MSAREGTPRPPAATGVQVLASTGKNEAPTRSGRHMKKTEETSDVLGCLRTWRRRMGWEGRYIGTESRGQPDEGAGGGGRKRTQSGRGALKLPPGRFSTNKAPRW